jgi:excisionase family DNA binding protein
MQADRPFLTIPEAAAEFHVSESSVRRWVKNGRLKAIRLPSGRRKIRREDVNAIMADNTPADAA